MNVAPGTFQKNPMNILAAQATSDAFRNVSGRIQLFFTDPRAPLPGAIKAVPHGLLKGDSETGYEIYRGIFNLAGQEVNIGSRLCFTLDTSVDWQRALHSFTWLADLHAGGSELQRAQARSLITDWLTSHKQHPACGSDLDVTARRLVSWLRNSGFLLEKASASFEGTFFRSLGRHIRYLSRHLPYAPQDKARLEAAIALCHGAVSLDIGRGVQEQAFLALGRELETQILPDGGHVSRIRKRMSKF